MINLRMPAFALLIAFAAQTSAIADDASIKITDPKLHSINYALDSLEHWITKAADGDQQRASALMRDHQKIVVRFARLPGAETVQYRYVQKRIKTLEQQIQDKATQGSTADDAKSQSPATEIQNTKPHPSLAGIESQLNGLLADIQRYQDNDKQRSRMRSDLETLTARYGRIPKSDHPVYVSVGKELDQAKRALQPASGPLQMSNSEAADFVEKIRVRYSEQIELPRARDIMHSRELTAEDVDAIISKINTFKTSAAQDQPTLHHIVEATGQGRYWLEWIETKAIENLERDLTAMEQMIEREVRFGLSNAKNRSELDVEKNNYAFNNEAMKKQNEELFDRTLRTLIQAERLNSSLNRQRDWSVQRRQLEQYVTTYRAKVDAASSVRDLPKEVGNEALHKIALEVFKDKKYGVGKVIKRIVNSKPVPRDRVEHKEFAGRIETIVRQWEEYQVTTVEEEDGKYFVYINNLAKFTRAPNPTPIDRWILKQRFKSGEISKDRL
ncbi:hypothetical protein [Crateriforma spongiae]|uniref:hypothetical protein n=1 Tax=Crateriforma spongiae TaxID=2724528 RepID=UPI001444B94C|nr:hypothetical protein [Crateriforma spongiae]